MVPRNLEARDEICRFGLNQTDACVFVCEMRFYQAGELPYGDLPDVVSVCEREMKEEGGT